MGIQTRWLKEVGFVKTDIRGYFEDTDIAKKLYEDLGIDLFEVERSEVLHLFPHH